MIWFVDASALVKRYVNETGSHWLRSELALHQVVIAEITAVELIAALTRRFRKGEIPKFDLHKSRKRFLDHRANQQYEVIETQSQLIEDAMQVAFQHGLRAYDAVQLATAIMAARKTDRSRFRFVAADNQLLAAASAAGLQIENPLNH